MSLSVDPRSIWRDFETDGVPSSGKHKPAKADIRQWSAAMWQAVIALVADADPELELPNLLIRATDAGAGTANAIVATTDLAIPEGDAAALIALNIFEENTSSPVTVAFNGASALTIKSNTGNDIAIGGLLADMLVLGFVSGSTFRLVSDQASAAIQAAAEAAAAEAEGYRDEAAGYATLALNNWVVDTFEGDGTDDPLVLTVHPGSINNCVITIEGEGPQPRHIFSLDGQELSPPSGAVWPDGRTIEVAYGTAIEVGAPADGTVTASKLGTGSVTRIKVQDGAIGPDELDDDAVNADHIDATAAAAIVSKLGLTRAHFSAHKNGVAQSGIASGVFTKLIFTTEKWDIGSYYDAANSRWIPPANRYFEITLRVYVSVGLVDASACVAAIYKNGTQIARGVVLPNTSDAQTVTVSALIAPNGTDYYEAYFYAEGAGNKTVSGDATLTEFYGKEI